MPKGMPSYRLHKASGQAVVTLSGRDVYLGVHGTPESRERYTRAIAEWLESGQRAPIDRAADLTVSEVLAAYWGHAESYYRKPDGRPTSQLARIRAAITPARELYGSIEARRFGPCELRATRNTMIRRGWCRAMVNAHVGCLVRAFRWAVSHDLVPVETWQALRSVEGLAKGRTEAPESEPVRPVPQADLDAVIPLLPAPVPDVVGMQLYTAARPGEVLAMKACDLDTSGPVWTCRRDQHKTAWRGHRRTLYLGPKAQEIARRYLVRECPLCGLADRAYRLAFRDGLCGPCADRAQDEELTGPWPERFVLGDYYLFSPAEAMIDRYARLRAARKSKVQPSQESRKKKTPRKQPGPRYGGTSYAHAINRACQKAGVPPWHPHQLRHNAATLLVAEFGWDVARIVLGQKTLQATRLYGADDTRKAMEAVRRVG